MTEKKNKGIPVTKEFVFRLTDAEGKQMLANAGALQEDYDNRLAKLNDRVKEERKKLKDTDKRIKGMLRAGRTGEEPRTVTAVMERNHEEKEVTYTYEGTVIERRTMTAAELQMSIEDFERANSPQPTSPEETVKRAKGLRQKIQKPDPVAAAHARANGVAFEDLGEVHKLETKRGTKTSAVDGPTRG